MGRVILTLPRLGETMEEAKVVAWLVAPGAAFRRGEVLLEVETDKTVVEVPALTDGILTGQLVAPGDIVALNQPIAEVEREGEDAVAVAAVAEPEAVVPQAVPVVMMASGPRPAASPAARAAARRAGAELINITGTGRRGRITAADVASGLDGDGVVVHRSGAGLPIVLLHGLFDDHRGWRDLSRRLEAAGHSVLAVDLPGHGASAPAPDLETTVARIAAALPAGPLRLIGHSLGAALAVRLALRLGGRVERVILSAPVGLGQHLNADFTGGMLTAETPAALARALALLGAGPMSATALTAELARVKSLRAGHTAMAGAVAQGGFQQIDITGDLARLTCPVTVLFGTEDCILDWRCVANLPAATAIHLVKGAGHLPHLAATDLLVGLAVDAPERRIANG